MDFTQSELAEIVRRVSLIAIDKIIGLDVKLQRNGGEYEGLCPFHNDKHVGSFKVNRGKGCWKCFSCGEGGIGGISFYAQNHGLSYLDAVFEVGEIFRIISPEEIQRFKRNSVSKSLKIQHFISKDNQEEHNPKADADTIDKVYHAFIEASPKLSEDLNAHLTKERLLIQKSDLDNFFCFPTNDKVFWEAFERNLSRYGLQKEVLQHIPGFYQKGQDPQQPFFFTNEAGNLGIIAHDAFGRINGIQVRRTNADKKKRYIWFSSGFADRLTGNVRMGCKIGDVIDVVPGRIKKQLICTEGKFKAIALQKLGFTALNMHGVSSWPVNGVAEYAKQHNIEKILLCYDADVAHNESVAKSARRFAKAIQKKGFHVDFVSWDIRYGKGIDDMINAGHKDKITRVDGSQYIDAVITPLLDKTNKESA